MKNTVDALASTAKNRAFRPKENKLLLICADGGGFFSIEHSKIHYSWKYMKKLQRQ